jgi:tetratricopeptide (TPR) repeat protein
MEYYNRALNISQRAKGKESMKCANIFYNIGLVYFGQDKFHEALENYMKALKI